MLNNTSKYDLPAFNDPEGCSVTPSLNSIIGFVKLSDNKIIFSPKEYT
jgi:hypothetical protein